MNIKDVLNRYERTLNKYSKQLNEILLFDTRLFKKAYTSCQQYQDCWQYISPTIRVTLPAILIPNHTIPHLIRGTESTVDITLKIDEEIIFSSIEKGKIKDPLTQLGSFNIIVQADEYSASWHLDRHADEMPEGHEYDFIHSLYHLTFGGYHMEGQHNGDDEVYGRAIIMRTPRLMHPPMELMLGLDFIFTQFVHSGTLYIVYDPSYIDIIQKLKKYLWKPYFIAQSKNYCDTIDVDGVRVTFDDDFVASTIKC